MFQTFQLKVKRLFPSNAGNREVQWTSSAPEIATVSDDGKVKALKKGVCTTTCTAKDGGGAYATCVIRVR